MDEDMRGGNIFIVQWIWENGEWLPIAGGIALVSFIAFTVYKMGMRGKPIAHDFCITETRPAKKPRPPILFETSKSASLYRTNSKAYLMLHVLMMNEGGKILVVRSIGAIMGKEKGIMLHEKFTAMATHLGRKSSYSFGSSENLLPLFIAGKTSRDAYLCFAFSNANIEAGDVALKVATSKGENTVHLKTDVVG